MEMHQVNRYSLPHPLVHRFSYLPSNTQTLTLIHPLTIPSLSPPPLLTLPSSILSPPLSPPFALLITPHPSPIPYLSPTPPPGEIKEAWQECEQLRKAVLKNNGMKRNIAKRLKLNEKEAEKFREELGTKITGEDRKELMELQYQVGRSFALGEHDTPHIHPSPIGDISHISTHLPSDINDNPYLGWSFGTREHGTRTTSHCPRKHLERKRSRHSGYHHYYHHCHYHYHSGHHHLPPHHCYHHYHQHQHRS